MRAREKLTIEEKISIALELIKRERSLEEIRTRYRVSHTTAYKIRNTFLDGGRRALGGAEKLGKDLEQRVRALEKKVAISAEGRGVTGTVRPDGSAEEADRDGSSNSRVR